MDSVGQIPGKATFPALKYHIYFFKRYTLSPQMWDYPELNLTFKSCPGTQLRIEASWHKHLRHRMRVLERWKLDK